MSQWSKRALRGVGITAFWLCLWEIGSLVVGKTLLLPSPFETGAALLSLMGTWPFWASVATSLMRMLLGYGAGVLLGVALGVLTAFSPFCHALLKPLRSIVKATPVASFILLVLLWMPNGAVPVFIAFLMVLPMIWMSVQQAVMAVDGQLLEMAQVFSLNRRKKAAYIYLPHVLPQLLAACVTGLGFAWKAGVAAEVLARAPYSIGKGISDSKAYLEIPELFAWTAVVIALSMLLEWALTRGMGKLGGGAGRWERGRKHER